MGRKKRGSNNAANGGAMGMGGVNGGPAEKKLKADEETGESFLVKKYRPDKHYVAMDAFVKYTKSHRMLDAAYVRWRPGSTAEKPFVFCVRIGGSNLGFGRGRTRDAAIDCAVRATFGLVGAHGYKNFPLDDDCFSEAPQDVLPPPPPPPPMVAPPLPHGVVPPQPYANPMGVVLPPPPLPPGAPPPLPPAPVAIPQPQLYPVQPPAATSLSVPSAVSTSTAIGSHLASSATGESMPSFSMNLTSSKQPVQSPADESKKAVSAQQKLKGGLTLVYSPENADGTDELSMEEKRASLPRYQKMLERVDASMVSKPSAA